MKALLTLLLVALASPSWAAIRHVDTTLGSNCLTTYNATTRTCGTGTLIAYNTAAGALAAATAGDTVLLRAGTYAPSLTPTVSGTNGNPITIENYPSETATISGTGIALVVEGRTDLVIRGLNTLNTSGFCRIYDSTRITIQLNTLNTTTSSGTTGGCKWARTTHSQFLNNTVIDGNDALLLQDASDFNRIAGNTFSTGRHSQVSLRCAEKNVIRGNRFANPVQKSIEIYDCDAISDAPSRFDSTKYNLIEDNTFTLTADSPSFNDYNAIQHAGQRTIARRNLFYTNLGGGLHYNTYPAESTYLYENRSYHNVFDSNECWAIFGEGDTATYYDNRVNNSIFWRNTDCAGGGSQVNVPDPVAVVMQNNALVTSDPGFVNAAARDYHLNSGSAQIDAGSFLTQADGAGTSSTSLIVDDPYVFFPGHGIAGEQGDLIQFSGQTATARITAINYATRTLTLATALTWSDNQGVSLPYNGSAPDRGAFEFVAGGGQEPSDTLAPSEAMSLAVTLVISETVGLDESLGSSGGTVVGPSRLTPQRPDGWLGGYGGS